MVSGHAAVVIRLLDSFTVRGHTHLPRTVGATARQTEVDSPTGINLAQCSACTADVELGFMPVVTTMVRTSTATIFQNTSSKMNQRLLKGYEPTLICFGSDILKIATVLVLLYAANTHFFSK